MTESIRYGIVGTGGYGTHHADMIVGRSDAELVAGAATSESSANEFASAYDVSGFADYERMFEQEDLDAVSVCTPSGTHARVAVAAMEAGIAPLVEKPLDVYLDRIDRMIDVADATGVPLGGVFQRRFTPERWTARRWVEDGRFGDMILADTAVKWHRSQSYYEDGWHGRRDMDGGVLLQQASHFVDLLQWLMGGIESVHLRSDTLAHEMECEDTAVALLQFENGAYGSITATTGVKGGEDHVELNGTDGSYNSGTFVLDDEEASPELIEPPCGTGLSGQIEDFVSAVREGRDPIVDGHEARTAIEVILAAYASASLDREVRVDEVRTLQDHT